MKRTVISIAAIFFVATVSVDAATVSGAVKDSASGAAVPGMLVMMRTATKTLARDTTDAQGVYSLVTDSTGKLDIRVRDTAANANYRQLDMSVDVTAGENKTVNIFLIKIPKTTISGVVGDAGKGGSPIAGAIVSLRSKNSAAVERDTTGTDGKFQFDDVTSGDYFLAASASRYVPLTLSADTLKVGGTQPIVKSFNLIPVIYGSLWGSVINSDSTAAPVQGAIVTLRPSASLISSILRDTTGDDGKYKFDAIETGTYYTTVTAAGYLASGMDSVKIADTIPVVKNLKIASRVFCTVSGAIITADSSGAPIKGATVTLRSVASAFGGSRRDTTGEDGKYQFDSVESGNYVLSVTAGALYYAVTTGDTVKITTNQPVTKNVKMTLIVRSSIVGTISDSGANAPLAQATVTLKLINGTGGTRKSTTGDDGKYSFDSVTNNKYILTVAAANYFSQSDTIDVVTAAPVNANLKLIPIIYTSLKGTIVDSTNGKPVAGVLVTYAAPGGKQTKTVTTGSDGKYKFDSVTTGDLILTIGGYHLKVIGLTILKAGEKDVNVALTKTTGIIEGGRDIPEASPRAILTRRGTLRLCNLSGAGTLRLIDAGGRQVFQRRFSSSETQWDLPLKSAVASGRYTVTVTRKNSITRERITLR